MTHPTTPHPLMDIPEDEMNDLDIDLDRVWHRIEGDVWAPKTGWLEQQVTSLLKSPALARALVTTPSLLLAWVLASAAVFGVGALVAELMQQPVVQLLAPAVVAIAVAFAYGSGADPAYEITRTMAVPGRMILLVRVAVVMVTNAAIGTVAMLLVPSFSSLTLAWLLPMTAISLLALAVASLTHSPTVGGVASLLVWITLVTSSYAQNASYDRVLLLADQTSWLPLYLLMGAVSVLMVWFVSGDSARRRELAGWL